MSLGLVLVELFMWTQIRTRMPQSDAISANKSAELKCI